MYIDVRLEDPIVYLEWYGLNWEEIDTVRSGSIHSCLGSMWTVDYRR